MIRPLDEQFEREKVGEIRSLQDRLQGLDIRFHPSRLFIAEIVTALEAGLILTPLSAAAALLELLIRDTVVDRLAGAAEVSGTSRQEIAERVEEDRSMSFGRLVDHLARLNLLEKAEVQKLKRTYGTIRVPLHHAIVARYVGDRRDQAIEALLRDSGLARINLDRDLEEVLEDQGLQDLAELVEHIEAVVRLGAV